MADGSVTRVSADNFFCNDSMIFIAKATARFSNVLPYVCNSVAILYRYFFSEKLSSYLVRVYNKRINVICVNYVKYVAVVFKLHTYYYRKCINKKDFGPIIRNIRTYLYFRHCICNDVCV